MFQAKNPASLFTSSHFLVGAMYGMMSGGGVIRPCCHRGSENRLCSEIHPRRCGVLCYLKCYTGTLSHRGCFFCVLTRSRLLVSSTRRRCNLPQPFRQVSYPPPPPPRFKHAFIIIAHGGNQTIPNNLLGTRSTALSGAWLKPYLVVLRPAHLGSSISPCPARQEFPPQSGAILG